MNNYHQLNKKSSNFKKLFKIFFPDKKVKPITSIKSNQVTPSEFYEKYGIIYNGSTTSSCLNSVL